MKRLLTALFLLISTLLHAQGPTVYIKTLSTLDGLSTNNINTIYQDSRGFMWFASGNKLNRYDGYHFKTFIVDTSEKVEINVFAAINNNAGDVLIGTNKGLYIYNQIFQKTESLQWFKMDSLLFQVDKRIHSIFSDSSNIFWIGSTNSLLRVDYSNKKITKYNLQKELKLTSKREINVFAILKDSHRNLWLGTNLGLYRFDIPSGHLITEYELSNSSRQKITEIKEDKNGTLWLAVYNLGLVRFDPVQKAVQRIPLTGIKTEGKYISGFILSDTDIWVSFYESGLFRFDKKTNSLIKFKSHDPVGSTFLDDRLNTIYLDRRGLAWLGGNHTGVGYFNSKGINFNNYIINTSARLRIWTVYKETNTYLWFGTPDKNAIMRYNIRNNKIREFPITILGGKKIRIVGLFNKDRDHLWVASIQAGLLIFNKKNGEIKRQQIVYGNGKKLQKIQNAMLDSQGRLWLSLTHGGVVLYNPATNRVRYFPLNYVENTKELQRHIFSLFESASHNIYMAASNGKVYKYDSGTGLIKQEVTLDGTSIKTVYVNNNGTIFVTTRQGLYEYDPDKKEMHHYSVTNGLPTDRLYSILPDDYGNLWISHKFGLSRFNYKTKRITNFNYWDGLANPVFVQHGSLRAKDGQLLFSSTTGITAFYPPEKLAPTDINSDIEISELDIKPNDSKTDYKQLLYKAIYSGRQLTLPYNSYIFMFDFFLTDFNRPNINQFKYKLDGLNEDWQDLGSRHLITFLNLPSGSYTLRLKGKTYDGDWIEKKQSIRFRIQTPFWQTWWFWVLVILTFISIGYLIFKLRVRAIRKRNQDLEIINKQLNNQIAVRQQVEELLRTSESKYRTLVESIDEGILTIDQTGILYFLNKRAAAYLNGLPEELSGRNIKELLPAELIGPFIQTALNVLETDTGREINAEINRNGNQEYFHLSFQPLKKDGETKPLVLCVMAETTARVELEEKLRQAQKMEAIGNLAGGVAHDFNNLLSVIRGYSFLLLKNTNAGKDILESIREIDEASERAQALTRQLLAFSRKQLMKPKIININQLINNLHKLLSRLIGENIHLKLELETDLKSVLADPGQMEQVLMNLVVNAKDAMPTGGQLLIRTENITSEKELANVRNPRVGSYIGIHVSDTGVGIERDQLPKIFDPFFTTKETGKGTGLGLSTVFGIVKQSDGYILVDSEPGKGTTFSIYLPQSEKTPQKEESTQTQAAGANGNKTILVIEDEGGVRSMISKMLKLYGYKSYIANNGTQGLEIYDSHKQEIDLILSDVVMPGMSGMEMVRILQKTAPDIPAIFMSGYTDDEIIRHGVKEDGIHFLQKPFDPDTLIRMIRNILNN